MIIDVTALPAADGGGGYLAETVTKLPRENTYFARGQTVEAAVLELTRILEQRGHDPHAAIEVIMHEGGTSRALSMRPPPMTRAKVGTPHRRRIVGRADRNIVR